MAFTYPKGPQDEEGILQYGKDARLAHRPIWDAVELNAWQNLLFGLGQQWIMPSTALRFWIPMPLDDDIPRPVCNRCKPLVNDLASKLVGFKPPITWGPGSDQEADYVAAAVADRVNIAIEKEADLRSLKPIAARWLGSTGNVWCVQNYDTSPETGTRFIQAEQCQGCGAVSMPKDIEEAGNVCPQCQSMTPPAVAPDGMPVEPQRVGFQPAIGPGQLGAMVFPPGQPIGIEYPRGRHNTEIETVFTVRFDPRTPRFHQAPWVVIRNYRDRAWVAEHYGDTFAESVKYTRVSDPFGGLATALHAVGFGSGLGFGSTVESDQCLVERLWIRPHPTKAPNGIHREIVGDVLVPLAPGQDGSYPYHDERGRGMLNVAHLEFDQIPGRSIAATRMDDVIPLQRDLNELLAGAMLHNRRMANALFFVPRGVGLSRVSGEHGTMVMYDAMAGTIF